MASDGEEEFDADDGFEADMEALRRACLFTETSPYHAEGDFSARPATATSVPSSPEASVPSSPDADEGEDDIELVLDIQKRFALSAEVQVPLDVEALCSIFPTASDAGGDCEDDLEVLRAIQRRFASYNDDNAKEGLDKKLHKPVQVGVNNITSEEESCYNFILERTNDGEGFPTSVDGHNSALRITEAGSHLDARPQSCDLSEWNNGTTENESCLLPGSSNFPQSAQAFVDAIKKNRAFQKAIRSKLIHIEAKIEALKKLKGRVKIFRDFQAACRKRTGHALAQKKDARVQLISLSRQKVNPKSKERKCSALYYPPPENSVVTSYREALLKFPISVNRERWSKEERENLLKGVKQQFQETMFRRSIDLRSDMYESSGDLTDIDNNISSIKDLDITPEMMRLFLPKVNWDLLASMYIPKRTGPECQTRWLSWEDPLINQERWLDNNVEDKNLLNIVHQKGLSNWIDIAISLGTNRTPFQCLARYQRSLNATIIKSEWTEEEDNKLRAAVEAFGDSNWQAVAATLVERTGTQCSNRWIKTLNPARERAGKWTADEDKRLKVAVMLFGQKSWKKLAEYVPGRTHVQCRERWVNCLDPSLNLNEWTEQEDLKLAAAIEEHGYSWSKVATCVAPRTDSQCRRRWKVLYPHEVPLLREARNIQKAAFISNFVDRETERPSLKPNDFAQVPLLLTVSRSETCGKRKIVPKYNIAPRKMSSHSPRTMNCRDNTTINKGKTSKQKPKRKMCTGYGTHPPLTAGMSSNDNESGGPELGVFKRNRKTSKLPPRKKGKCRHHEDVPELSASDEIETTFGEGITFTKSTVGGTGVVDFGNGSDANQNSSSSSCGQKAIKLSKKGKKPSRKKCNDPSLGQGHDPLPTSSYISKGKFNVDGGGKDRGNASPHNGEGTLQELSGTNIENGPPGEKYDSSMSFDANTCMEYCDRLGEESHRHSLPLRHSVHDIPETRNVKHYEHHKQGKERSLKGKDVAPSSKVVAEVEEGALLEDSFIQRNHSAPVTVTKENSSSSASKSIGSGIQTMSPQTQGGIEDEMPLAHFFNKVKRRRLDHAIVRGG
ncbi:unnamed protein product [Cuscuta campestris]|nr:unnamed protein product [Cuscuta campestris]